MNRKFGIPWLALAIIVAILALLSFYFFVVIRQKSTEIEQRGFRILTHLGQSLKGKDMVIWTMINSYKLQTADQQNSKHHFGSVVKPLNPLPKYLVSMKEQDKRDGYISYMQNESFYWTTGLKEFVTPLIKKDFFSHYILIKDGKVVFNTYNGDLVCSSDKETKTPQENSPSFSQAVTIQLTSDTTKKKNLNFDAGSVKKIKIHGTDYLAYFVPLNFHSPDDKDSPESWILGGLVPEKRVNAWERDLPPNVIILLGLIVIIIIFSLPVARVFIAGPSEKLTRAGITFAGISLITGSVLAVLIFSENLINSRSNKCSFKTLHKLNETIKSRFDEERNAILSQMIRYDTNHLTSFDTIIDSLLYTRDPNYSPEYIFFKTVFWADSTGNQSNYLTPYKSNSKSKVFYRDYFKNPEKYEETVGKRVYRYNMEPVYSNTTGEWLIAFAMPSVKKHNIKIITMTTPMHSLYRPLLPPDFEFCLVDKTGRIYYHSKELFNLNDNLIEECQDDHISGILYSNSEGNIKTMLHNQLYMMSVSPIDHSDLFMVTMFNNERISQVEAISTYAVIGVFAFVLLVLSLICLIFLFPGLRKSLLAGNSYLFSWLLPGYNTGRTYNKLTTINGMLILILLGLGIGGLFDIMRMWMVLVLFLLVIFLDFIFSFTMMNYWEKRKDSSEDPPGISYLRHYSFFILSWIILCAILPAVFLIFRLHQQEMKRYITTQQLFLAQNINDRTDTLYKTYNDKIGSLKGLAVCNERDKKGHYYTDCYNFRLCPPVCENIAIQKNRKGLTGNKDELLTYLSIPLIKVIHSSFNEIISDVEPLIIDPLAQGQVFESRKILGVKFRKINYSKELRKEAKQSFIYIDKEQADILNLLKQPWTLAILIPTILLFIGALYFLIRRLVWRLFDFSDLDCEPRKISDIIKTITDKGPSIIVITLDPIDMLADSLSGWRMIDLSLDKKHEEQSIKEKKIIYNVTSGIPDIPALENRIINLENTVKGSPLILLLDREPSLIIARFKERWPAPISGKRFDELINRFEKIIATLPVFYVSINHELTSKDIQNQNDSKVTSSRNTDEKGKKGEVDKNKSCPVLALEYEWNQDILKFKDFITCGKSKVSIQNGDSCKNYKKSEGICYDCEKVILDIQKFSRGRYEAIWNALSMEEKMVLMDLAQDTLVNLKNKKSVQTLLLKGILKVKGVIAFQSYAFKNFILTEIDKTEFLTLEKKREKTGIWSRYRAPLILIATSIIIFLFFTQQNILSNLNSILISVTTLMGVYFKFSGFFDKPKEGKDSQ